MLVNFNENGNITKSISWFLLNASICDERTTTLQETEVRTPGEDNSIFNSIYISGKIKQQKYSGFKKMAFFL